VALIEHRWPGPSVLPVHASEVMANQLECPGPRTTLAIVTGPSPALIALNDCGALVAATGTFGNRRSTGLNVTTAPVRIR